MNMVHRAFGYSVLGLLVFSFPFFVHAGFGVSPPQVKEDRLVRGIRLDRIVYLVQGAPDRDLEVELFVDSPVKEWIRFPQGNPVLIPKGVQQFPLAIEISIPEDADLGVYNGTIRVTTVPEKADQAGEVAISIGGVIDLDLTVGNDIIVDLDIRTIKILNIKEGDDPEADVTITNNGNASASPDTATFELFNKFGELRLAYAETEDFTNIPAFNEKVERVTFPIDIHLAPGEYWGHVKIYKDNAMIGELKTVFNVTEKTFAEEYGLYAAGGAGAFVILALSYALMRRRRR